MEANEYQLLAAKTAGDHDMIDYAILGIGGEAGELLDLQKKWKHHGHPYDRKKFLLELGDLCWYIAMYATAHGFLLSEVMEENIKKLQKRYPEGFTSERSINRNE